MTPGKGSKYREFYDLSGRITCMQGCRRLRKARSLLGILPVKPPYQELGKATANHIRNWYKENKEALFNVAF